MSSPTRVRRAHEPERARSTARDRHDAQTGGDPFPWPWNHAADRSVDAERDTEARIAQGSPADPMAQTLGGPAPDRVAGRTQRTSAGRLRGTQGRVGSHERACDVPLDAVFRDLEAVEQPGLHGAEARPSGLPAAAGSQADPSKWPRHNYGPAYWMLEEGRARRGLPGRRALRAHGRSPADLWDVDELVGDPRSTPGPQAPGPNDVRPEPMPWPQRTEALTALAEAASLRRGDPPAMTRSGSDSVALDPDWLATLDASSGAAALPDADARLTQVLHEGSPRPEVAFEAEDIVRAAPKRRAVVVRHAHVPAAPSMGAVRPGAIVAGATVFAVGLVLGLMAAAFMLA